MRGDTGDHEAQPGVAPHLGHNPVGEHEAGQREHVRHQEQRPGDQGQLVHHEGQWRNILCLDNIADVFDDETLSMIDYILNR